MFDKFQKLYQNQLILFHNYIRISRDVDNEMMNHRPDLRDHRVHRSERYQREILHRENEEDDKWKEEENKHKYNTTNVQRDASINLTKDQDFDFDDEDYENDDKEMPRYLHLLIHIERPTTDASFDESKITKRKTKFLLFFFSSFTQ